MLITLAAAGLGATDNGDEGTLRMYLEASSSLQPEPGTIETVLLD